MIPVWTRTLSSQRLPVSWFAIELKKAITSFLCFIGVGDVGSLNPQRPALVACRAGHRREPHDAEREVLRLAALVGRLKARGVPAAVQEHDGAGIGVEVGVRLAELEAREARRQEAGIEDGAQPFERVDDARVGPGQLAPEELVVVFRAELLEQRLVGEVGAREGTVADAKGHRRPSLWLRFLDEVEEGIRRELRAVGIFTPSSSTIFLL